MPIQASETNLAEETHCSLGLADPDRARFKTRHYRRSPYWHLVGKRLCVDAGHLLAPVFIVVAFAGYIFGQFPASQVPYAYFLVGLTTIAVATSGVTDPADVWQIGHTLFLYSSCRWF